MWDFDHSIMPPSLAANFTRKNTVCSIPGESIPGNAFLFLDLETCSERCVNRRGSGDLHRSPSRQSTGMVQQGNEQDFAAPYASGAAPDMKRNPTCVQHNPCRTTGRAPPRACMKPNKLPTPRPARTGRSIKSGPLNFRGRNASMAMHAVCHASFQ